MAEGAFALFDHFSEVVGIGGRGNSFQIRFQLLNHASECTAVEVNSGEHAMRFLEVVRIHLQARQKSSLSLFIEI